ncbi:hypothetical protein D3C76_1712350 [compost metagenome]
MSLIVILFLCNRIKVKLTFHDDGFSRSDCSCNVQRKSNVFVILTLDLNCQFRRRSILNAIANLIAGTKNQIMIVDLC